MLVADSAEPDEMASKLERLLRMGKQERDRIGRFLREQVLREHSLDTLMGKIVAAFRSIK
jgi:hypothetical protein